MNTRSRNSAVLRWIATVLAAGIVLWLVHPPLLRWAIHSALSTACRHHGFQLDQATVDARIGKAVQITDIVISGRTTSRITIASITGAFAPPGEWFSKSARLIDRVAVSGLNAFVATADFQSPRDPDDLTPPGLRWIPVNLDLEDVSFELAGRDRSILVSRASGKFHERSTGRLTADEIRFTSGDWAWSSGEINAVTAWKNGTLWLGEWTVRPDVVIQELAVDFPHPGGPTVSLLARVFGGTLRGDLTLREGVDAAFWASNIPIEPLPGLSGLDEKMSGRLVEGRLTFRGDPARPADAEASLRLYADAFRWNDRGWESLEAGASLIHQRLVITDFDLRQKENSVNVNGEISVAEGWSQIAKSPFLINISANFKDLGTLGDLIGDPLDELSGRMSATGSIAGRDDKLEGFLSVESSGIGFRTLAVNSMKIETVFRRNEIEIAKLEVCSKKDFLTASGTVAIASPHAYAGEFSAKIDDLARILRPFRTPGANAVYGGSLEAKWQGDGTWKSHSGAFQLELSKFVSDGTPAGLTGRFGGTYSPQNVYFSELGFDNGPIHLDSRATIAASGLTLSDLEIRSGSSRMIEGSAFLPVNVFDVLSGSDWREATDAGREAYIRAATLRDVQLADLLRLTGQRNTMQGTLRLAVEAVGLPSRLMANGSLSLDAFRLIDIPSFPQSDVRVRFASGAGEANFDGVVAARNLAPITFDGRIPFGLTEISDHSHRWINPSELIEINANFPRADLTLLQPFVPGPPLMAGAITGNLSIRGTLNQPFTAGSIAVQKGSIASPGPLPPVTNIDAVVNFENDTARIQRFRGTAAGGTLELSGGIRFPGPDADIHASARGLRLNEGRGIRAVADFDLDVRSNPQAGSVTGDIRLFDGVVAQRLEILPSFDDSPESDPLSSMNWSRWKPRWNDGARWTLNIGLRTASPIVWRDPLADGRLGVDLRLKGTLARPVPIGRVTLTNVRAFSPGAVFTIPDGRLDFLPGDAGVPHLDIRGTAQQQGLIVHANAIGSARAATLIVRSEPSRSQRSLALLVASGIPVPEEGDSMFTSIDLPPSPPRPGDSPLWNLAGPGVPPPAPLTVSWRLR